MIAGNSNSFKKSERLCKTIEIDVLFAKGKSFREYPLVVYYKINENEAGEPVKVFITVPKKRISKAVKRNLLKRRIREAYRKRKKELLNLCISKNICINIAIIYSCNKIESYNILEQKIVLSLQKIIDLLKIDLK